ncbi:MAG: UDP-N-acetylmuramate dehydrogenase [Acidimicrobiales bacterium]
MVTLPAKTLLSAYTTLGVGGPAGFFVPVRDLAELARAIREADAALSPVLVLGGGSNMVVSDDGFPGTVLQILLRGVQLEAEEGGSVVVTAAAGESWCALVERCVGEGLAGIEALSGIPGLVGAAPVQNIGAYGQEVAGAIKAMEVWDRVERRLRQLLPEEAGFGYRDSVFKRTSRYVVTKVSFRLVRSRLSCPVRYAELARYLGIDLGARAPLDEVAQAVMHLRRAKGMLLGVPGPDSRSVGSFFVNPVLDGPAWERLKALAPGAPGFPTGTGTKVPAAWLVERAGFARGYRKGGAAISSKHALALTVLEGGTAADLLALAREVRDGVHERFGVVLEPEPVLVCLKL